MVSEKCRLHLDRAISFYLSERSTLDRAAVIEATRAKTTNPKKLKLIDWRLKGLDKIMEGCHKEFENSIDRLINCECGDFTVKTGNPGNPHSKGVPYHGDLYDVIEAQVKQGKDINEVKKIVGGIWDDTTDAQIESAFRDAKVIHEHMKAKHPELMRN